MAPFLRSRPAIAGAAAVAIVMGAVGFVPLFGGPGYESSLAAGIAVPLIVAIATAVELSRAPVSPLDALSRGAANGGALAAIAYVTVLLHGLRAGFCDAAGGSLHFALGPVPGALLAGAWGALVGQILGPGSASTPRWRRALRVFGVALLGALGPIASMLASVGRFYASPMVFAYDPFVGYFSGTLYDTVIDFSGLVSYRAGTAATLFTAFVAALQIRRKGGEIPLGRVRPGLVVLGAAGLAASVASVALGYRLGHWHTPATIQARLGGRTSSERCDVVHPSGMRPADAQRYARDCDAHIAALEKWFGARGPDRITVYLFADGAQKGALMGATDTYIAKPWRKEVYLQVASYPAPVLGHELAHAVAGAFGRGPFAVAGSVGGLLPDPGIIEGVAVAASPPEGDLTPDEWAKAMKDLGILPPLARLFGLGFFGENSSSAYTVSGAFVGWIHARHGGAAIRAWYGGKSLPEVTGASWADLERGWHESLDTIVLPEAARTAAKARFDRPGVFGRRCPHVVDGCKERADSLRGAGDDEGAIAEWRRVLALDPNDAGTRLSIARARVHQGRVAEGMAELERVAAGEADPGRAKVPRHIRDRAIEELADMDLAEGRADSAASRYADLMTRTVDEDRLRTLEVKIAAAHDPKGRAAIVALLIGGKGRGPDKVLATELLSRWAAEAPVGEKGDGLAWYLLGRHFFGVSLHEEAAERLDRALAGPIAVERVRIEAERLRQISACAVGDAAGAARFFALYAAHQGVSTARRDAARALLGRCTMGTTGAP